MNPSETKDVQSNGASVAVGEESGAESIQEEQKHKQEDSSQPSDERVDDVKRAEFQSVSESSVKGAPASMDLLLDVVLPVSIELGKTTMTVKEVLSICQGSVIELERAAGEPVDILVSGRLLGKGEVVVLNDRFGVRITELANPIGSVTGV